MRRKSERNKSKSSAEKKSSESTSKKSRRSSRRRKRSTSHSSSEDSDDAPLKPAVPETQITEVTPPTDGQKISGSNSDEDKQEEQPIWKVKTTEAPSGEIQKLKICLQRPPTTPERTEKSPRRRRGKASSQSDDASLTPDEKPSRKKTRKSTHSQDTEGSSLDNSVIEEAEKDECMMIVQETNEVFIGKGKLDCSQPTQESENKECIQDSRTESQADESLTETKTEQNMDQDSVSIVKAADKQQEEPKDETSTGNESIPDKIIEKNAEREIENEKQVNIIEEKEGEKTPDPETVQIQSVETQDIPIPEPTEKTSDGADILPGLNKEQDIIDTKQKPSVEESKDSSITDEQTSESSGKENVPEVKEKSELPDENQLESEVSVEKQMTEIFFENKTVSDVSDKQITTEPPDKKQTVSEVSDEKQTTSEVSGEENQLKSEVSDKKQISEVSDEKQTTSKVDEEKQLKSEISNEMQTNMEVSDQIISEVSDDKKLTSEASDKTEITDDRQTTEVSDEKQSTSKESNEKQIVSEVSDENQVVSEQTSAEPEIKSTENQQPNNKDVEIPEPETQSDIITSDTKTDKPDINTNENSERVETMQINEQEEKENNDQQISIENKSQEIKETSSEKDDSRPASPEAKEFVEERMEEGSPERIIIRKRNWGKYNAPLKDTEAITSTFILSFCPSLKMLNIDEVKLEPEEPKEQKTIKKEREVTIPFSPKEEDSEKETSNIGLNRKISIVNDEASKLQPPPSPAKNPVSPILFITNLVRPFTVKQLQELLSRTGKIVEDGFWTDRIKSKCYVQYETEDEAEATRNALHGVQWPIGNGKKLIIDFGTTESMTAAKNAAVEPPTPKVAPEKTIEKVPEYKKEEPVENERWDKARAAAPVREWDLGKVPQDRHEHSRSRDRTHSRSDRNDKKRPPRNESPSNGDHVSPRKKKKEEPEVKMMDDLFHKTKATPSIYWLPLSPEQIAKKQQQRLQRMAEHKRRMEESRRMERDFGRGALRSRRRTSRYDGD